MPSLAKSPILYCTGCKGMLIPMAMLEGLIDESRERARRWNGSRPLPTKKICSARSTARSAIVRWTPISMPVPGNAVIDSCEECCLIWLDRGVLMRIAHAPDVALR